VIAQAIDSSIAQQARWDQDVDALVQGFSARGSTRREDGIILSRGQLDFKKLYPPEQFSAQIDTEQAAGSSHVRII
jgi:hypothetical protein